MSFDWRDPRYGIAKWPPGLGNPVSVAVVMVARRRARAARKAWEQATAEGEDDDEPMAA
ncbi:hypothetical protein ACFQ60_17775 [Streptomyces zhihengii]|uniref:Uncharacterized protein n=1 Tax=Streptomyces zhihengii TaxID=1818004 RepID=A0ABS2UY31_9ACTN|nr:hypothetical protein [Streptomyces zhihengii]MBM9621807.1 hypothetical protein [Streptomyces zhihengii]